MDECIWVSESRLIMFMGLAKPQSTYKMQKMGKQIAIAFTDKKDLEKAKIANDIIWIIDRKNTLQ